MPKESSESNKRFPPDGTASADNAGARPRSPSPWIVRGGIVLGVILVAWAALGSWYIDGKAQICSPVGRAVSRPGMPCYQSPPSATRSPACQNGSWIAGNLCTIDETYRGSTPPWNDNIVGQGFEWLGQKLLLQLDFLIVPSWNAFFMSDTNRIIVALLFAVGVLFASSKLGDDVCDHLGKKSR